ncbi:hypothetical protein T265_12062 [Opisthorchis viverrini]|uniref:RNA-binding protein 42 n=1 Tax=Opisthorchis viverrini TaxID=6198 RepID=A0A074Z0K0_OPIVI|nr:hypothetical protein T265_12062 [Opisthorchis viverrini]KER18997.1 hypothetical protein T265_12062 [Opisthorchis viverrini]
MWSLSDMMAQWLECEITDRKVRGSNPTSASRISLYRLGQPGSIPALMLPSGGMAVRRRSNATAERSFPLTCKREGHISMLELGYCAPEVTDFHPTCCFCPALSGQQEVGCAPLHLTSAVPMYLPLVQPTIPTFQPTVPSGPLPVQHRTVVTNVTLPTISPSTTTTSKSTSSEVTLKVITAPPQMAGPTELAERAKEAATAAAKSRAAVDEDDDDVTRALLAAAAGVTYTRVQGADGREKVRASITKPPLTPVMQQTNSTTPKPTAAAAAVVAAVAPLPNATKVVQTMIAPTVPPPVYRPPLSTNSSAPAQTGKKKRFIRVAAGMTWEDPTLAEWDPNDFRIFCGDLGNEVSDDTLTRAFNRYASFQKAKVVRDKRTGKSRGYGFVSFSDPADFTRAMREMNGKYVGNRPIKLKRSDWRTRQLETYRKKEKEKKKCSTIHILTTEIHALVDPPLRSVATCFSLANRPIAYNWAQRWANGCFINVFSVVQRVLPLKTVSSTRSCVDWNVFPMPNHRLPNRVLFSMPNSEWRNQRGGIRVRRTLGNV